MTRSVKLGGLAWQELVEIQPSERGVLLAVRIEAGRFFRSTSFELSADESREVAQALLEEADAADERP